MHDKPQTQGKKRLQKILYWVFTIWLSLGMTSTGLVQLLKARDELELMQVLGYPSYLLTLLGIWKLLGTAAVLLPGMPLLKEWAYAGFFFAMSGALFSHLAIGHTGFGELFPPLLLLILTGLSWYFRPQTRKLPAPEKNSNILIH